MAKSLEEWLQDGEQVYQGTVAEYRQLEEQLRELATRWRAKKTDIDRLAAMLGKTPLPEEHTEAAGPAESHHEHPRATVPRLNLGGPAVRR